jgi:hypothetical protein
MSDQELQIKSQAPELEPQDAPIEEAASEDRTQFSSRGSIPPVAAGSGAAQLSASERGFGSDEQTLAGEDRDQRG